MMDYRTGRSLRKTFSLGILPREWKHAEVKRILQMMYQRVTILETWLSYMLDSDADLVVKPTFLQDSDHAGYKHLLHTTLVAEKADKRKLQLPVSLSHVSHQQEIVGRAVQCVLHRDGVGNNVLSFGFGNMTDNPMSSVTSLHNLEYRYPSSSISRLQSKVWKTLLSRVGDMLMSHLLEDTSIFILLTQPVVYLQVTGEPVYQTVNCTWLARAHSCLSQKGQKTKGWTRKKSSTTHTGKHKRKYCVHGPEDLPAIAKKTKREISTRNYQSTAFVPVKQKQHSISAPTQQQGKRKAGLEQNLIEDKRRKGCDNENSKYAMLESHHGESCAGYTKVGGIVCHPEAECEALTNSSVVQCTSSLEGSHGSSSSLYSGQTGQGKLGSSGNEQNAVKSSQRQNQHATGDSETCENFGITTSNQQVAGDSKTCKSSGITRSKPNGQQVKFGLENGDSPKVPSTKTKRQLKRMKKRKKKLKQDNCNPGDVPYQYHKYVPRLSLLYGKCLQEKFQNSFALKSLSRSEEGPEQLFSDIFMFGDIGGNLSSKRGQPCRCQGSRSWDDWHGVYSKAELQTEASPVVLAASPADQERSTVIVTRQSVMSNELNQRKLQPFDKTERSPLKQFSDSFVVISSGCSSIPCGQQQQGGELCLTDASDSSEHSWGVGKRNYSSSQIIEQRVRLKDSLDIDSSCSSQISSTNQSVTYFTVSLDSTVIGDRKKLSLNEKTTSTHEKSVDLVRVKSPGQIIMEEISSFTSSDTEPTIKSPMDIILDSPLHSVPMATSSLSSTSVTISDVSPASGFAVHNLLQEDPQSCYADKHLQEDPQSCYADKHLQEDPQSCYADKHLQEDPQSCYADKHLQEDPQSCYADKHLQEDPQSCYADKHLQEDPQSCYADKLLQEDPQSCCTDNRITGARESLVGQTKDNSSFTCLDSIKGTCLFSHTINAHRKLSEENQEENAQETRNPLKSQVMPLLKVLIHNYRKCKFFTLLNYHCQGQYERKTGFVNLNQPNIRHVHPGNQAARVLKTKPTTRSSRRKLNKKTTTGNLLEDHIPHSKVFAFLRAVVKRTIPIQLFGSTANMTIFLKNIRTLVSGGKFEKLCLGQLMRKMEVKKCTWLRQITCHNEREHCLAQLLWWLMVSFTLPVIRAFFYLTDTSSFRNRILFYRKSTWLILHMRAMQDFKKASGLQNISKDTVTKWLASGQALGVSTLRWLPKTQSLRPIVNMSRKPSGNQPQMAINKQLMKLLRVLTVQKTLDSSMCGYSVFGMDDVYTKFREFKVSRTQCHDDRTLYFVKTDVSKCFDSIKQQLLFSLVKAALVKDGEQTYMTRKYASVYLAGMSVKRAFHVDTTRLSHFQPDFIYFIRQKSSESANHDIIFVDQVCFQQDNIASLLHLLSSHLLNNVIKVGQQHYLQRQGISQGSVVSTLLASIYLSHLETEHLTTMKDELLIRWTDDYLFITPDRTRAEQFLQTMVKGFPDYNCFVNVKKILTSFPVELPDFGAVQHTVQGECFPWCGLMINTSSLEMSTDYSRYSGIRLTDTVTFDTSYKPGQTFCNKLMRCLKIKCHVIFMDLMINSLERILMNTYQVLLFLAQTFHCFVLKLPLTGRVHCQPDFFCNMVSRIPYSMQKLINRKLKQLQSRSQFPVPLHALQWLTATAFLVKLHVYPGYKPLKKFLHASKQSLQRKMREKEITALRAVHQTGIQLCADIVLTRR